MKASSVSLYPHRFLPRLSGEHIVHVFTEIYEGRNATGMISLFLVVIKNKQMEYWLGSVIVLTEKSGFDLVRLPNMIELNRPITFDYVQLCSISECSIAYPGSYIDIRYNSWGIFFV